MNDPESTPDLLAGEQADLASPLDDKAPRTPDLNPHALQSYAEGLVHEIGKDLVIEITGKLVYEDILIVPKVISLDSRGEKTISRRLNWLANESQSSIIGDPGSGKTTALRMLALQLLRQIPRKTIPIFVPLAAFKPVSNSSSNSFKSHIDTELHRRGMASFDQIQTALDYDVLLLLDGWDEIQDDMSREIVTQFLRTSSSPFVITSRRETSRSLPQSDRYEIQPVEGERVLDFVQRRLKSSRVAKQLYARIQSDPKLRRLAQNPLTLSIMTIVYEDGETLGTIHKTSLFDRAFNAIMKQYHRHHGAESPIVATKAVRNDIECVLRALAYQRLSNGKGRSFTGEELLDVAQKVLERIPNNLTELLSGHLGIIRHRSTDRYEFYHLWYQEYLAAREILSHSIDPIQAFSNRRLAPALPFAVGLLNSSSKAFDLLMKLNIVDPFSFCRAMGEAEFTSTQTRELLLKVIKWGEQSQPSVPVREEMAAAIAEARDCGVESLRLLLMQESQSDYVRRTALETLFRIDHDTSRLNDQLAKLLDCKCKGLLWHVIEAVGRRKVTGTTHRLKDLANDLDPITACDAIWVLRQIDGEQAPEIHQALIESLFDSLWADDSHVRGHALRTIGRLKLREGVPHLEKYLSDKSNNYRWIVPQAAVLIGEEAYHIVETALNDSDELVVELALRSLRDAQTGMDDKMVDCVRSLVDDPRQLPQMESSIGELAHATLNTWQLIKKARLLGKIYLARHCKTLWNIQGKLQGKTDLPLDEIGRREAASHVNGLRELNIDRIVTSTARRARQTGEIYANALNVPLESSPMLRELDHGDWEGRTFGDLEGNKSSGYVPWLENPETDIPGSTENSVSAQNRVVEAVCEVVSTYCTQTILLIGHKHINALLNCRLWDRPLTDFKQMIDESTEPRLLPESLIAKLSHKDQ